MPTIMTIKGFVFYFFSADCHERAHVHIGKGGGNGKIWIAPEIEVFYLKGFKQKEKKQILKLVQENHSKLIE